MKIKDKMVVAISYEVEADGKIVDKAGEDTPLDYIQGTRMIIPKLESELEGKEEGESFECVILPEDAYGEYDLSKVFEIPKDSFMVNGKLREDLLEAGRFIPMLNSAGEVCHAMVVGIKEDKVTMDFNAPMAGKTLHFKGKVLSVRQATEKELTDGLHGEFLPLEEGCHCGCHDGCHGHHEEEGECCCHGEGHCQGEGHCHDDGHGEGCCHGHKGK